MVGLYPECGPVLVPICAKVCRAEDIRHLTCSFRLPTAHFDHYYIHDLLHSEFFLNVGTIVMLIVLRTSDTLQSKCPKLQLFGEFTPCQDS